MSPSRIYIPRVEPAIIGEGHELRCRRSKRNRIGVFRVIKRKSVVSVEIVYDAYWTSKCTYHSCHTAVRYHHVLPLRRKDRQLEGLFLRVERSSDTISSVVRMSRTSPPLLMAKSIIPAVPSSVPRKRIVSWFEDGSTSEPRRAMIRLCRNDLPCWVIMGVRPLDALVIFPVFGSSILHVASPATSTKLSSAEDEIFVIS